MLKGLPVIPCLGFPALALPIKVLPLDGRVRVDSHEGAVGRAEEPAGVTRVSLRGGALAQETFETR